MAEHIHIKKALIYWIATIGYMGLIFALSSQNQFGFFLPENGDKVMHILAYMPLGFLLHMSLRMSGLSRYIFAAAVLLASIYGITDELHQSFVPGRFASTGDIAADVLGAIIGSIGASLFSHGMG